MDYSEREVFNLSVFGKVDKIAVLAVLIDHMDGDWHDNPRKIAQAKRMVSGNGPLVLSGTEWPGHGSPFRDLKSFLKECGLSWRETTRVQRNHYAHEVRAWIPGWPREKVMEAMNGNVSIDLNTLVQAMNESVSSLVSLVQAHALARLDGVSQQFLVDERFFDVLAADGPNVDLRYHKWDYRQPKLDQGQASPQP